VVGRDLPNMRPNGEDHRGAVGGETRRAREEVYKTFGMLVDGWLRRLIATRMIVIHKALVWLLHRAAHGLLAIRFGLQE
jgi:hypothetical protein